MAKIRYQMFGTKDGNFSPSFPNEYEKEKFLYRLSRVYFSMPSAISMIYAPCVNFTTTIADIKEDCDLWKSWFARTALRADGGLVYGFNSAVGIFNADCPLLCLWQGDKLLVAHIGYRCLIRANPKEEGIIETSLRHFDPKWVKAFIFGGIGPCCWKPEYEDKPEVYDPKLSRHPRALSSCIGKTTERGPFGEGHTSVDLYRLAKELLKLLEVPEKNIEVNAQCTCCAQDYGERTYWSHTRHKAGKQEIDGRNFSLAWLEK